MKRHFNKMLAAMLAATLCTPALPAGTVQAADSNGVTFMEEESISVSELGSERVTLFNEGWKFILDDLSGAEAIDYSDSQWEVIDLPHDYSITQDFTASGEAESGYLPGGTGWYRKSFTLPAGCADKSIVLNFDGVYRDAYVYVNGEYLGEHHYGYSSFAFDISDYVECDGTTDNVVAVKVVHEIPSSRWYSGSGIYRDVNLIITDKVHVDLDGTEITTPELAESNGSDGTVNIKAAITNDSDSPASVTVSNKIYDSDGTLAATSTGITANIAPHDSVSVEDTAIVDNPKLWTIWSKGEQNLYNVHTELSVNGSVVDEYDSTLGFRWFEFNNESGFCLNGENVKLNGVCMHHDQGALGSAAYYDAFYRQLSIMKEMGANAIRITHNPGDKQYLQICNELGLIVIEEFFDGWNVRKNGNTNDFTTYFTKNMTDDNQILCGDSSLTWSEFVVKSTVKRDRNNPCLILWSLGNELGDAGYSSEYPNLAKKLINSMKSEDSYRQATIGVNQVGDGDFNEYMEGVIDAIIESGGMPGFNYGSAANILRLAEKYGHIIASETSSAVNSRSIYMSKANQGNADGKYHLTSYDTSTVGWGRTAHDSMWATLPYDNIAGEFVWTGFDYIGEPTPWNGVGSGDGGRGMIPNSSYFGIVETTGFEKDTYYLYRSQWKQDDTTLHLVTAWDSENMINNSGKTPIDIYSNAPVVKLYRDGQLIGTATRTVNTTNAGYIYYTYSTESNDSSICTTTNATGSATLYASFDVAYQSGTISAKAFESDGTTEITNVSGTTSVSTPGTVSKLVASMDKNEISADGSSLAYITIDLKDAQDNLDTKAINEITFSLDGPGVIAGVDNGDQATTKKYQQSSVLPDDRKSATINAYAGKALVIVRSTKIGGKITLTASSGDMNDTVEITAVAENIIENELTSYRMIKHFYAPVGTTDITLPTSVTATYTNGDTKKCNITWNAFDPEQLKKPGNFRIDGSFNDEANDKTINVYITGHIYNPIATADNYSGMTKPNTMPNLPSVVMTYYSDGTPFEAFPVKWDLTEFTEAAFSEVGTIHTINGLVTALDSTYPVTASIRVAQPVVDTRKNVGTLAARITEDQEYSDTLSAVIDGEKGDDGNPSSRWTTFNQKDVTESVITLFWSTQMTADMIDLYYFFETNKPASQLPVSVKFEYSESCNYDEASNTITSDRWQTINHNDVTDIDYTNSNNTTTGKSYTLEQLITFEGIRITFTSDSDKYIGLNEIEVLSPTESFYANTSAALDGVTIGDVTIDFNDDQMEYEIDASSWDDLKLLNALNAAVTVIRVNNQQTKLITVSEDGKETKTYTLTLTGASSDNPPADNPPADNPPADNPPAGNPALETQRKELSGKLALAKATDSTLYTEASYANLQSVITKIESQIGNATEEQLKTLLAELEAAQQALVKRDSSSDALKNGDKTTSGNVEYQVLDAAKKTAVAAKLTKKTVTKITILDSVKINGVSCTVTQINAKVFKGAKKLKTLVIGKNVTTIGKKAFNGCTNLKKVTFKGTAVKKIGTAAFKKTKSAITVKIPAALKKNKKKSTAFKKALTKAGMSKKLKLK